MSIQKCVSVSIYLSRNLFSATSR